MKRLADAARAAAAKECAENLSTPDRRFAEVWQAARPALLWLRSIVRRPLLRLLINVVLALGDRLAGAPPEAGFSS